MDGLFDYKVSIWSHAVTKRNNTSRWNIHSTLDLRIRKTTRMAYSVIWQAAHGLAECGRHVQAAELFEEVGSKGNLSARIEEARRFL